MEINGVQLTRSYSIGVFYMRGSNLACFYSIATGSQVMMNRDFDRSNPDLGQLSDGRLILNVDGKAYVSKKVNSK